MKKSINKFYDINKFPAEEGILVFPISISKISNSQSAKKCFDYVKHFTFSKGGKIIKPIVGLNVIYGDYLYFYSNEKAFKCKEASSLQSCYTDRIIDMVVLLKEINELCTAFEDGDQDG